MKQRYYVPGHLIVTTLSRIAGSWCVLDRHELDGQGNPKCVEVCTSRRLAREACRALNAETVDAA